MTVQEDARDVARRIVEEVLADHAARSATPAAPPRGERTSAAPRPPQAIPTAPIAATDHPDTPAWRTARRIVDEVLAAHASTPASAPGGDTLVANPPNVAADGSTPIERLEVPTLLIDVSDSATEVVVASEAASPAPVDSIPDELFAGHIVVSDADGDDPAATALTVEPPAEPIVEPVPDDPVPDDPVPDDPVPDDPVPVDPDEVPDPVPVDPDPAPGDPDPVPVDPDPVPVDPDPVPVDPDPVPLEPQPVPIDADGRPPAVTPTPTARSVSTEAATIASRIVAEVLADHAEREAAAAVTEVPAAGTTAQLPTATDAMTVPTGHEPEATHEMAVTTEEPEPTQEVPARHEEQEPGGGPLPIPGVAAPMLPADPAPDVGTVLADVPPPLADEVETEEQALGHDEVQGPRRTGRWLMTTIVGAVALAFLFPLAVRALRELISLG